VLHPSRLRKPDALLAMPQNTSPMFNKTILMTHPTLMTHLMNRKSKLPLKSMDQPGSPPTLMTFSKDLSTATTPQETGSQREELKPLPRKPSPPTKDFMVQDSPNI
jgi:hypothetical protein